MIDSIQNFAAQLKAKFNEIILLALTVNRYIMIAIEKLQEIVDICNANTGDTYNNCRQTLAASYTDCRRRLGTGLSALCELVRPLPNLCDLVSLPQTLCSIPEAVVAWIDSNIGQRLRAYLSIIRNELYFEADVKRVYYLNETSSKTYRQVAAELQTEVERKFHFVRLFARLFNLVSLALVVWILITATLYHMGYLSELSYDNMYIDSYLADIDRRRSRRHRRGQPPSDSGRAEDEELLLEGDSDSDGSPQPEQRANQQVEPAGGLFPLPAAQEARYLRPFSLQMNEEEQHKLLIAGLVWLAIVGYISFFVVLDYTLYELILVIRETVGSILFKGDLPVVDVSTKNGAGDVVYYNRSYLSELTARRLRQEQLDRQRLAASGMNGSLSGLYRRLMDSLESDIPDDLKILDSLESCLPRPSRPDYGQYLSLLYLGLFTLAGVVVEAYALRTRHCIANLYYPIWAKRRAIWLYEKMLDERARFVELSSAAEPAEPAAAAATKAEKALELGLKVLGGRVKR